MDRREVQLNDEEQAAYDLVFADTFSKQEFKKLLKIAQFIDLPADTVLLEQGKEIDHIYLLTSGTAVIEEERWVEKVSENVENRNRTPKPAVTSSLLHMLLGAVEDQNLLHLDKDKSDPLAAAAAPVPEEHKQKETVSPQPSSSSSQTLQTAQPSASIDSTEKRQQILPPQSSSSSSSSPPILSPSAASEPEGADTASIPAPNVGPEKPPAEPVLVQVVKEVESVAHSVIDMITGHEHQHMQLPLPQQHQPPLAESQHVGNNNNNNNDNNNLHDHNHPNSASPPPPELLRTNPLVVSPPPAAMIAAADDQRIREEQYEADEADKKEAEAEEEKAMIEITGLRTLNSEISREKLREWREERERKRRERIELRERKRRENAGILERHFGNLSAPQIAPDLTPPLASDSSAFLASGTSPNPSSSPGTSTSSQSPLVPELYEKRREVIGYIRAGRLVGEMSLLTTPSTPTSDFPSDPPLSPRSIPSTYGNATVTTLEAVRVLSWKREDLRNLFFRMPSLAVGWYSIVSSDLVHRLSEARHTSVNNGYKLLLIGCLSEGKLREKQKEAAAESDPHQWRFQQKRDPLNAAI